MAEDNQEYELLLSQLPLDVLGEVLENFEVKLIEKKTERGAFVLKGRKDELERTREFIHTRISEKLNRWQSERRV
ncbi:MAG: hypothetical protein SVY15_03260 [Halobacteriota archaeon]|nr:hypothetical protein [Halobacteriota archaeon]